MEVTYTDKIYQLLYDLKIGEWWTISEHVRPDNKEKFITEVKGYIQYSYGHAFGFDIEFDGEYNRLRKISTIVDTPTPENEPSIKKFFSKSESEIENPQQKEIENLKKFFDERELPKSMQLDSITFIPDVRKSVNSLFEFVIFAGSKPYGKSYLHTLNRIKAKPI